MTTLTDVAPDYRAALEGAVLADEQMVGRLFMRGRDRAALLQRLTSNDIERLKPGQGVATVIPTPIGRIIDLLIVHALEDALLVTTSPGQGPAIFAHLKKNIFFNDQVTLEPAARSHAQFALYGPDAAELLGRLAGVPLADLRLHHTSTLTILGTTLRIARRAAIGGNSFTLFIPSDGAASVRAAIEQAGAMPIRAETLDTLRIEQGLPAFGRELSQEYIPLETGLLDAVSFTKGCYVGQEIIARMESRGRLAKQLRGLRLAPDVAGAGIATPTKLLVDGKDAGDLTSVTFSPRYGLIGLAYVRTAHAEPGTQIGITGSEIRGEVAELPFR
jgi:aminomethyltransferase